MHVRLFGILSLALLVWMSLTAAGFDHSAWDRVLKRYVNDIGEVDYAGLKANRKDLDEYIQILGEWSPANRPELFPTKTHELAYWMNAYNAFVMRGVVDHYPTRSVRDLGALYGFFRREDYTAGGKKISLLHLENVILRKKYDEPRIHFGIVCASISCPRLSREAFTAENLAEQLERLARQFINEHRNLTINPRSNEVTLSAIFDWYRKDFEYPNGSGGQKHTLLDYVRRYASGEKRRALDNLKHPRIKHYSYDWSINDLGSRAKAKSQIDRDRLTAKSPSSTERRGKTLKEGQMNRNLVAFQITRLAASVAEGVPVEWQGKKFNSGPLTIELDETAPERGNEGVLDYSCRRARAKFHVRLKFPEFASMLESLGVDSELTRPVCAVLYSEGEIREDHSFVLSGRCKLSPHQMLSSEETVASILPGH